MATRPSPLAAATDADVTAALVPFIARHVWSAKRARVTALCVPWRKRARARDLVDALDPAHVIELVGAPAPSREATALARVHRATPGVFVDEISAYSFAGARPVRRPQAVRHARRRDPRRGPGRGRRRDPHARQVGVVFVSFIGVLQWVHREDGARRGSSRRIGGAALTRGRAPTDDHAVGWSGSAPPRDLAGARNVAEAASIAVVDAARPQSPAPSRPG